MGLRELIDYVNQNAEKGACKCGRCFDAPEDPEAHQPDGHTTDMIFFKVSKIGGDKEEFTELIKNQFPHWLDGKEHNYLEMGADIGDQGLAMAAMGLGKLLGVWELITPETMMIDADAPLALEMAGAGFLIIQTKEAVESGETIIRNT